MLLAGFVVAHPFGLSSVNRYIGVEVTSSGLHIAYVLDFAELPAIDEIARLDADSDNSVTPAERERYLDALLPPIVAQWIVAVNGARVSPRILNRSIEVSPGQGGLSTLRVLVELEARAELLADAPIVVRVHDATYASHSGYRDIRADDSADAQIVSPRERPSGVTASNTLRRIDDATFTFRLRRSGRAVRDAHAPHRGTVLALLALLTFLIAAASIAAAARRRRHTPP